MKNVLRFLGIITITAVIGLSFTACGGVAHKDFIGTWEYEYDGQRNIDQNRTITSKYLITSFAKYRIVNATPVLNTVDATRENYPSGFRFDTEVVESNSSTFPIGNRGNFIYYMHIGKREMVDHSTYWHFVKQ